MREVLFGSLPTDRREAARSALTAAFGPAPLTALQRVTSGASALIYRIEVADRPYLLLCCGWNLSGVTKFAIRSAPISACGRR